MSTNSRFAVAIHTLAMLAKSPRPVSSSHIAASVNTNPVTIRKILCELSEAGLIETLLGVDGGAVLSRPAREITLLDIYHATHQGPVFNSYASDPNPSCPCGRVLPNILDKVFGEAERALEAVLARKSLADVMHDFKQEITQLQDLYLKTP